MKSDICIILLSSVNFTWSLNFEPDNCVYRQLNFKCHLIKTYFSWLEQDLVNDISGVETSLVHLKSLKRKFTYKKNEPDPEVVEFIKSLLTTGETEVPGGPKSKIATMIRNFFSEAAKVIFGHWCAII